MLRLLPKRTCRSPKSLISDENQVGREPSFPACKPFKRLKDIGHDADTVYEEQLAGHGDLEVWQKAQSESRFLITQDLDFADLRKYVPGSHHGILLVRLNYPNRRNLTKRVVELFQTEDAADWSGCFVVATELKIRVQRPTHKQKSLEL